MVKLGRYTGDHLYFDQTDFLSELRYKDGDEISEEDGSYLVGYYWAKKGTARSTFEGFAFVGWVDMEIALMGFDDAASMI